MRGFLQRSRSPAGVASLKKPELFCVPTYHIIAFEVYYFTYLLYTWSLLGSLWPPKIPRICGICINLSLVACMMLFPERMACMQHAALPEHKLSQPTSTSITPSNACSCVFGLKCITMFHCFQTLNFTCFNLYWVQMYCMDITNASKLLEHSWPLVGASSSTPWSEILCRLCAGDVLIDWTRGQQWKANVGNELDLSMSAWYSGEAWQCGCVA